MRASKSKPIKESEHIITLASRFYLECQNEVAWERQLNQHPEHVAQFMLGNRAKARRFASKLRDKGVTREGLLALMQFAQGRARAAYERGEAGPPFEWPRLFREAMLLVGYKVQPGETCGVEFPSLYLREHAHYCAALLRGAPATAALKDVDIF
jgi:hypothetical protein